MEEVRKEKGVIDAESLYDECGKAFAALSILLGERAYFFDQAGPDLFDASVFAYTNILLDETLGWRDRRLMEQLAKHENLVEHRRRILDRYFAVDS